MPDEESKRSPGVDLERLQTNVDEAFQSLYEEITDLRRKLADQASQTQRIQRTVKLDEREFNVGKQMSERRLIETVQALTQAVQGMTYREIPEEERVRQEGEQLYQMNKWSRLREVKEHLQEIERLDRCAQVRTRLCPCGEHAGIMFLGHDEKGQVIQEPPVVENMCPRQWWFQKSRLEYQRGNLKKYLEVVPFKEYLKEYAIEE